VTATIKTVVLRPSTGAIVSAGDYLRVRYQGNLVDQQGKNGLQFDGNWDFANFKPTMVTDQDGKPTTTPRELFDIQLGITSLIEGWQRGLQNRRIGEIIELTIPPSLAYKDKALKDIPANSTLRFKIEIVAAFTSETFSPAQGPNYSYASLANWGIVPKKIGLENSDILSASATIVGTNANDAMSGSDVTITSGNTNTSNRDLIIGLAGNDRITGGQGGDFLIGGSGVNTYVYTNLLDSSGTGIGRDKIYGFTSRDKIDLRALEGTKKFSKLTSFTGQQREIIFKRSTSPVGGTLQLDWDGDKNADLEIFFVGTTTFNAAQLIL